MSWIKTINYQEANSQLKKIYDRVKGKDNNIDNVLLIHSLRPHTLNGHMAIYKSVLHHSSNTIPKWFLESLGVYVSYLNNCNYCVEHHFTGLKRLLNDNLKSNNFMTAVVNDTLHHYYNDKHFAAMVYAKELTTNVTTINKDLVAKLRDVGYTDGEILEINQVVSYFNYANRSVVGLGVNLEGDILGLSPNDNDDEKNWNHQ